MPEHPDSVAHPLAGVVRAATAFGLPMNEVWEAMITAFGFTLDEIWEPMMAADGRSSLDLMNHYIDEVSGELARRLLEQQRAAS